MNVLSKKAEKQDLLKELLLNNLKEERDMTTVFDLIRKEGREEGEKGKQITIARNMLKRQLSEQLIADVTGLSIDEVKTLQEK